MRLVKATNRGDAIRLTIGHFGIPKGFASEYAYWIYLDGLMETAGHDEYYVKSDSGKTLGYFSTVVVNTIHHHGDILEVGSLIIPGVDRKVIQMVNKFIYAKANAEGCKWVSRYKHTDRGVLQTYKEVPNGRLI